MEKITRRQFLEQSARRGFILGAGMAMLTHPVDGFSKTEKIDQVSLGKTGLKVSRLAWGTGTSGYQRQSAQTKLGTGGFLEMAQTAYESGITFFDMADSYGSHPFMREVLKKHISREKVTLLSKLWVLPADWIELQDTQTTLDRFRKELDTDYLDIVLLHAMISPDWPQEYQKILENLNQAKEKGVVKAVGVSCHNMGALLTAARSDWVDVIFARINHDGKYLDHYPENVMKALKIAHDNGKGVVGMKIFGNGKLIEEEQREASLKFVLGSKNVDAMTIGFKKVEQIADTIQRVNRILKEV